MISKEIEFKYSAKDIELKKFVAFCKSFFKTDDYQIICGQDDFYENKDQPDAFCRHRVGDKTNQLTFKRKLSKNNIVRIEHNINLEPSTSTDLIKRFCEDLGFMYNTSLRKNSFIFSNELFTAVYYICYTEDRNELGRFIELELSEEIDWGTAKKAVLWLKEVEKKFMPIGISPKKRITRSLWELYRNRSK